MLWKANGPQTSYLNKKDTDRTKHLTFNALSVQDNQNISSGEEVLVSYRSSYILR